MDPPRRVLPHPVELVHSAVEWLDSFDYRAVIYYEKTGNKISCSFNKHTITHSHNLYA